MLTMTQLAKRHRCSRTWIRKLHAQGRLLADGKKVKPVKAGNVLLFPDNTVVPEERAAYGSLTKKQRDAWR